VANIPISDDEVESKMERMMAIMNALQDRKLKVVAQNIGVPTYSLKSFLDSFPDDEMVERLEKYLGLD
jgi:hypothetical protein